MESYQEQEPVFSLKADKLSLEIPFILDILTLLPHKTDDNERALNVADRSAERDTRFVDIEFDNADPGCERTDNQGLSGLLMHIA